MKKLLVLFVGLFLTIYCNAQNANSNSEKDKKSSEEQTENMQEKIEPTINNNLIKEFERNNFAPKTIYFRLIGEELEALHDEMLT